DAGERSRRGPRAGAPVRQARAGELDQGLYRAHARRRGHRRGDRLLSRARARPASRYGEFQRDRARPGKHGPAREPRRAGAARPFQLVRIRRQQLQLGVRGIGLLAPGLHGWPAGARVLSGAAAFEPSAVPRPAISLLPPAERRRCAPSVAWALAVAQEAVASAGLDAGALSVVFVSSDGDGDIVHRLCSALATPAAAVSPTDFHNSVHNAATGYWSIGAHSMAASTALCAYDNSFAA